MPIRAHSFWTLWLATLFAGLASAGCSRQNVGPTSEELQPSFAELTPAYWSIAEFDIVASESVGSQAEPRFESRFRAVLTLEEDTFKKVGELDEYSLLLPVATQGDRRSVSGVATSVPREGAWQVEVELESDPFGPMGKSRSSFPGPTVIKGSDNESALRLLRADQIEEKDPEPRAPLSPERRRIESIVSNIKILTAGSRIELDGMASPPERFRSCPTKLRRAAIGEPSSATNRRGSN